MDVILTHEQADFDALGSLLAATLLENHQREIPAIALVPRRINRNGRAFLALYGAELPFTDPHDLPKEPIENILLVDTQSLITLKGQNPHTTVRVIDHHPLRSDFPVDWELDHAKTGACTTMLVERLLQLSIPLSTIQATLLQLGIYEDTGSLSYHNTTSRDLRAAAFLLERGASLRILSEYLNPPLSDEQRQMYETLLAGIETQLINGQRIIISKADARELDEEISSIAHKLRDLLEPDALFLLVNTSEGIRLVARSTTDQIDVAAIAREFNGGGHIRAAAALIKKENDDIPALLDQVYHRLIELLPRHVHPVITVSQIMSRRPHLISPQTSIQEAVRMMQRYGYEGFPVIKDGQVIGLLTRRAVDRANSHGLSLSAGSLMDYGQVSVHPADSLATLQEVMVSSGWGQIPVVDPENNQVIGIVTRTDLLKTLASEPGLSKAQNLAEKLEAALPANRLDLLKTAAAKAQALHMAVYIVGGFVRDLLLDRPNLDFDLVVEGNAITLAKALEAEFGGHVVVHSQFGTAKWLPADRSESLDLITARTEFYERPTALPTVEVGNIKLDLHRRDFTINTLALRLDGLHYGELHNYWGGLNDLRLGIVRVLHSLSFVDDPTRLLRAVRFEQRFGFRIDARTLQLMEEARPLLKQVSGDRLRHELNLILAEEKAVNILSRLDSLGILVAIHPEIPWSDEIGQHLASKISAEEASEWELPVRASGPANGMSALSEIDAAIRIGIPYLVWLAHLSPDAAHSVARRLKFSANLTKALVAASSLLDDLLSLEHLLPSQLVERLEGIPLTSIYAVYRVAPEGAARMSLRNFAARLRHVSSINDGDSLKARGLPPSPRYRIILKSLRDAWLDGKIHNVDEEEALLGELL